MMLGAEVLNASSPDSTEASYQGDQYFPTQNESTKLIKDCGQMHKVLAQLNVGNACASHIIHMSNFKPVLKIGKRNTQVPLLIFAQIFRENTAAIPSDLCVALTTCG